VLCGGDKIDLQISRLRRPTQIIVATPGRLMDLLERKALSISTVKHLILDEADEMLSLGFQKELLEIFKLTADRHSTWLFSATFPDRVNFLIRDCMQEGAHFIKVDQAHVVNRDISHKFAICDSAEKTDFIHDFLTRQKDRRGLIFCRTKAGAISLCRQLAARGHSIDVLQGDLTQLERDKVMRAFKKERVQFLIATDVAARGIDIEGLSFVLHHQPPEQLEYYTHRSGRTGRAGKKGASIVLLEPRERKKIERLEEELGVTFREL
jgi:ATP-dependent RNA helicase DeaD